MLRAALPVFVFSTLFNLLLLTTPLYIIQIYQRVLTSQSTATLAVITAAAILALAFAVGFDTVRRTVMQRLSHHVYSDIGERVVSATLDSAVDLPDRARPMRDVDGLRQFFASRELLSLMDLPFVPLFVLILFMIHPMVGAVALTMILLMLMLTISSNMLSSNASRRTSDQMREAGERFAAFSENGTTIRSMGMSRSVAINWLEGQLAFAEELRRANTATTMLGGFTQILRMTTQIIVMGTAAYYAVLGVINPGMIFACSILSVRALTPVEGLAGGFRRMGLARESYARLKRLLGAASSSPRLEHLPESGALEATALVYIPPLSHVRQPVLRGATFRVSPGEVLAVAGPAGGGKSVLGQLLTGAIEPTTGTVRLAGIDLKNCHRESLADAIGYLPQISDVLPGTIAENIARYGHIDPEQLWAAVRRVGLEAEIGTLPKGMDSPMRLASQSFSPGVYRRLLLARAIYGAPKLIVLDDPCVYLDQAGDAMLCELVGELKAAGCTVILISPRQSLLPQADRLLVLHGGMMEPIRDLNEPAQNPRQAARPTMVHPAPAAANPQPTAPAGGMRLIGE
ncbi:ATP-binding cassette subfamily C protein/ATP-binding cassette subfamily C protein EexD [Brevirhabdus pacifica]|nr:ATP-binding cassette subfamily C protein/ATP-binding cassette subfamily C protein EexD [Brevirhabdus pacifica]